MVYHTYCCVSSIGHKELPTAPPSFPPPQRNVLTEPLSQKLLCYLIWGLNICENLSSEDLSPLLSVNPLPASLVLITNRTCLIYLFLNYYYQFLPIKFCFIPLKVKESESHVRLSWNSLGRNTGVESLSLLQGIFPTQESNPGLLYCRQILYQLSHQEVQEYWSR